LPLEGAVVRAVVDQCRADIVGGRGVSPATVVAVDGGYYLVTDGNNRVYAARAEGQTEVAVRVVDSGANARFHANEAKHALRRNRLGFENIVEVASDDDRTVFTEAEARENEAEEWLGPLIAP